MTATSRASLWVLFLFLLFLGLSSELHAQQGLGEQLTALTHSWASQTEYQPNSDAPDWLKKLSRFQIEGLNSPGARMWLALVSAQPESGWPALLYFCGEIKSRGLTVDPPTLITIYPVGVQ